MNITSVIHPEGWRFFGIFAAVALLMYWISPTLGWIGGILTAWCFYFFRNPKRVTPLKEGLIISPADGRVVLIKEMLPPSELEMPAVPHTRVSIFLNVFDVHINRIPMSGLVKKLVYHPGKFFNASLDKASEFNERNSLVVENSFGQVGFVQIAGLIARRIRCDVQEGDEVDVGSQYGLIRFGSRMDVYLPIDVVPMVCIGQRMIAGETVLADCTSSEPARVGHCVEAL